MVDSPTPEAPTIRPEGHATLGALLASSERVLQAISAARARTTDGTLQQRLDMAARAVSAAHDSLGPLHVEDKEPARDARDTAPVPVSAVEIASPHTADNFARAIAEDLHHLTDAMGRAAVEGLLPPPVCKDLMAYAGELAACAQALDARADSPSKGR